jgi:hypothetical protein
MSDQQPLPAGKTFKLFSLFNAIVILVCLLFIVSAVTLTGTKAAGTFEMTKPSAKQSP